MKIKKSKHVHHDRGYTPVVNCKLTSRLVCGTETDIQGVAVAVAHPQKVDIEQMAHDISHATTDVKMHCALSSPMPLASPSSFSLAERAQVNLNLARSGVSCTKFSLAVQA